MPLDAAVRRTLVAVLDRLKVEGTLPSEAELERAYGRFRERFGPEVLRTLNGEQLLRLYDWSDSTSLTHWLTHGKANGPAGIPEIEGRFGYIGKAVTYERCRLFRRKPDGQWVTGKSKQASREVSRAEAATIIGRFRDQLVAGCQVLSQTPGDGSDDTYAVLQQRLERAAADIEDLAWAHKYFHMLYPALLDDFHSMKTRAERLSLLQQVPPHGKDRYRSAGRFVLAARELGVPMNHLTAALNNWDRLA